MRLALVLLILFTTLFALDRAKRLSDWRPLAMRFDASSLSTRERELARTLIEASGYIEKIYWEQSDPDALKLLRAARNPGLKRLLIVNGSRYDLLDHNRPLAGSDAYLPGRNLYPPGLTREQIEQYVAAHPDQKAAIYDPFTILRWNGRALEAIPYHAAYRDKLEPASRLLIKAAGLTDDKAFARYLELRAKALLTDDYYASDSAWVDLKNPKVDLIFAPYETYLDDVLGVKTSWEAAVLIRDDAESRKLDLYQKYVPEIQKALPLTDEDKPNKVGQSTPLEVMDAPYRAGDLRHGYQAVADNLPNDPRIHAEKGTKKIFFKNYMDARVNEIILPLARRVMRDDQASKATGEGYLAVVVLHEICHGLGPAYARMNNGRKDIREAIGPIYAGLEEAKADVVGMFGLQWLMDRGALPKGRTDEFYDSYVAGIFRTVRFGTAEAHGRAEMMEFNFLAGEGAIRRDGDRYLVDKERMAPAVRKLAKELLEIEATGDRARAETLFARYEKMPEPLKTTLDSVQGVPVDIDPIQDCSAVGLPRCGEDF
jgi:hypothetical protein